MCDMDVVPLCLQIAQDVTPVQSSLVGYKSMTPVNMSIFMISMIFIFNKYLLF
jgi:hypothetical protein